MIKPNKKQRWDVATTNQQVIQTLKSTELASIAKTTPKQPINNIITKREIIIASIVSILLLGIIVGLIYLITIMSGGGIYTAAIILFILLILLCVFVIHRVAYGTGERLFFCWLSQKNSKKSLDCTTAIIVSKTEDSYIVTKNDQRTTMVDYYCEYIFFDGTAIRTGYFRRRDPKDQADQYKIDDKIFVCFTDKASTAIHPCKTTRYRGIDYAQNKVSTLAKIEQFPQAKPPTRAKRNESLGRTVARIAGLIVFGAALIFFGIYMWQNLTLSPNMVTTVRTFEIIMMAIGGVLAILGFASIFKMIFEYMSYIALIKNCNFAYGLMYDDGTLSKKQGYAFIFKDDNSLSEQSTLQEHISTVEASKKITLNSPTASTPTVLLIAYNNVSVDIVDKLEPGDLNYPITPNND